MNFISPAPCFVNWMIRQDEARYNKQYLIYKRKLAIVSEGNRQDAGFYFCTDIKECEKRFDTMGIALPEVDMLELLEHGRKERDFSRMSQRYKEYFDLYYGCIRNSVISNERKDIEKAKQYIQDHYKENLSLEILADVVHMNPFYFSSYFKKNANMNFKEYINKVRLEQAVSLLLSTDRTINEIAAEVGFRDVRSFLKIFQKYHGETPGSYRKKIIKS
ncbi:YesN/AraC family two-component response regulator [Aequitasia blattaphilus]|uniref:AraC family transcriptional regulator n=1 Tax=Aequitasia blattaphilus TaxID=2949332 RepID=A0ABT1EB02_9FIRM|nr:AraC family transcriptional regulator [Aequitasia blattaphilus]MCP1103019.1 AraC family transcriptional regulator [Aequitasia blattaphilus]MCR8615659.1 AraC family transcriptional regulator [Aequitasia blattaphilus]